MQRTATAASPPSVWMFLGHARIVYMRNLYPGLCIQRDNAMQAQETTPTLGAWGGCPHCVPVTRDGVVSLPQAMLRGRSTPGTSAEGPGTSGGAMTHAALPVGCASCIWGPRRDFIFFSVILCSKGETRKISICGGDKPGHKGQTPPFFCSPRCFFFFFCLLSSGWPTAAFSDSVPLLYLFRA